MRICSRVAVMSRAQDALTSLAKWDACSCEKLKHEGASYGRGDVWLSDIVRAIGKSVWFEAPIMHHHCEQFSKSEVLWSFSTKALQVQMAVVLHLKSVVLWLAGKTHTPWWHHKYEAPESPCCPKERTHIYQAYINTPHPSPPAAQERATIAW